MSPQSRLAHSVVQGGLVVWVAADRFERSSASHITLPHYMLLFPIVFRRQLNGPIIAAPDAQPFVDFLRKRPEVMAQTHIRIAHYREFALASIALATSAGLLSRIHDERFPAFAINPGQTKKVAEILAELAKPEKLIGGPRNPELSRLVKTAHRLCDWFAQHTLAELCFLLRVRP